MELIALIVSIVALLVALWAARAVRTLLGATADTTVHRSGTRSSRRSRSRGRSKQPHFTFEQLSPHRYALRNDGHSPAYDVRVDTGELSVHEGSLSIDEFPPGYVEEYLLIQPLQSQVSQINVTWYTSRDALAEAHVTPFPLGPRPVENDVDQGTI